MQNAMMAAKAVHCRSLGGEVNLCLPLPVGASQGALRELSGRFLNVPEIATRS